MVTNEQRYLNEYFRRISIFEIDQQFVVHLGNIDYHMFDEYARVEIYVSILKDYKPHFIKKNYSILRFYLSGFICSLLYFVNGKCIL